MENRKLLTRKIWIPGWQEHRKSIGISFAVAALVSLLFYTHGLRHPQGAVDAIRTYFVYETVEGHDKTFWYYLHLFAVPFKSGGAWWFGTPVVMLAIIAYALTFLPSVSEGKKTIRFIAYASVFHVLIYSLIAYKTPWLACLPWAHVCVLAGCALWNVSKRPVGFRIIISGIALAAIFTQFQQSRRAIGRYASDERNPFAYVPTRRDAEALETWLNQLQETTGKASLEPMAVVGSDYWPLPWYLRQFEQIGYWKSPTAELSGLPLVFTLPETTAGVAELLKDSHMPLPRGLRTGVPLHVFVRNDVWKQWMEAGTK
jgi:predicted membrane-bound mannosyltransferase